MELSESQEKSLCDDCDSPLSLWSGGYSIEVPALPALSDATDPYGSVPLPMGLAEISAEPPSRPSQEFIDRLDMVCS